MKEAHRICSRCIMDASDPGISFDGDGVCSHCRHFDSFVVPQWHPDEVGMQLLKRAVSEIKREGRGRRYDCAIGLSGGVDSSYLAYVACRELGLRPLAVHVDAGWNSELATKNIEGIVRGLGIDLVTYVVDWEEMRDVQRAFLLSAVANQDVPQDHAFFSALYRTAQSHGLRHILSGGNFATESIMPDEWAYNAMDLRHLEGIHRRYGTRALKTFPRISFFRMYFWNRYVKRMRVLRPLNFMPYDKTAAITLLERELGFRYYGGKHFESRFTRWQQLYFRPAKFGFDERRAYLSSLVLSGQIGREEAIRALADDHHNVELAAADTTYVLKKLGVSEEEFRQVMDGPAMTFRDYPSNYALFSGKTAFRDWLERRGLSLRRNS